MRKVNSAAYVKTITPHSSSNQASIKRFSERISRSCADIRLDDQHIEAYLSLHIQEGRYGQDETTRSQEPNPRARSCPQSPSRRRPGSPVRQPSILRPPGPGPAALRDGPTPSGRWLADQRRRPGLRRLEANLLQSADGARRRRAGRPRTQVTWPQGRAQGLSRGDRLRYPSQSRRSQAHHVGMPGCHQGPLRHRDPSAQPGTRPGAEKKAQPPS